MTDADLLPATPGSLPDTIRIDTGATGHQRLPPGGSPAASWRLTTPEGPRVVKVLRRQAETVDGHDITSFLAKPAQLAHLHRHRPGLSPYVVRALRVWDEPEWAAYLMPWVPGLPLVDLRHDPGAFLERAAEVFDTLGRFGYDRPIAAAPAEYFDRVHVQRVRRRALLLSRHLPRGLLDDDVLVGGRPCRPAAQALAEIERRLGPDGLLPAGLHFPVHGDLNLGNVLIRPDGFTVLDPRGTLQPWDVVYDLAKAVFSLTVFQDTMDHGIAVTDLDDAGSAFTLHLPRPRQPAGGDLLEAFVDLLRDSDLGYRLSRSEPDWLRRLVVVHAVHCLAEAACRISDTTERHYRSTAGLAARRQLALGLHLGGRWLVNDLADTGSGAGPDPIDHLRRFRALLESAD